MALGHDGVREQPTLLADRPCGLVAETVQTSQERDARLQLGTAIAWTDGTLAELGAPI
jgi:hypothetical protein